MHGLRWVSIPRGDISARGVVTLVLVSIGGRAAAELARLLRKPVREVEARVACAKDALAEELGVRGVAGVEARLAGLVATFDLEWTLEVECAAMACLMGEAAPVDWLPRYWLN